MDRVCFLEKALKKNNGNAQLHVELGAELRRAGHPQKAIEHYREAVRLCPEAEPLLLAALGVSHKDVGDFDEAIRCFQQAVKICPHDADAWSNLGTLLKNLNKLEEAEACLREGIKFNPTSAPAHNNLGNVYLEQNKTKMAMAHYRRALEIDSGLFDAHLNMAKCLATMGKNDEAIEQHHRAISADPEQAMGYFGLGTLLLRLIQWEEAVPEFEKAIELKPDYAQAHANLATTFINLGRSDDALVSIDRALALDPALVEPQWNKAVAFLRAGRFKEGWQQHEWRTKLPDYPKRVCSQPLWDGSLFRDKTLLLLGEQGFGDTIQFSRFARHAKQRGGRVILECQKELRPLLERCEGVDETVLRGEWPVAFDLVFPLLSLPMLFEMEEKDFAVPGPYLHVPSETSVILSRLDGEESGGTRKLRVGFVWAGSPTHPHDKMRSCPLDFFKRLMQVHGVRFYSLQKGPAASELASLPTEFGAVNAADLAHDFAGTASIILSLDIVIAVDTSVAHLAGALGKPVWLLLPAVPDWRWMMGRDDTPWYSSMLLFRQKTRGDWKEVFGRLEVKLREEIGKCSR